jgi:hypothetical protein
MKIQVEQCLEEDILMGYTKRLKQKNELKFKENQKL